MGLLNWIFGKEKKYVQNSQENVGHLQANISWQKENVAQHQIKFNFLIYESDEEIESNKWYQKIHWKNKNFVNYRGVWDSDWRWSDEGKVKVVGLSRGTRAVDFVTLACLDDFKMYLEDEPDNPVNKNARKVMACATVEGSVVCKHIGYLPDHIATKYAGIELDIRPSKAFLPTNSGLMVAIEVALLVRSARYLNGNNNI
jgi:hypothetical protein